MNETQKHLLLHEINTETIYEKSVEKLINVLSKNGFRFSRSNWDNAIIGIYENDNKEFQFMFDDFYINFIGNNIEFIFTRGSIIVLKINIEIEKLNV